MLEAHPVDAQPVDPLVRDQLLGPIIAATRAALGEMAGSELTVRGTYRQALRHSLGDIAAVMTIKSGINGSLVLGFPRTTATALARRIMTGVTQDIDESLLGDCLGEIANVIAGQAKALLAESPFPCSFVMAPTVMSSQEFLAPPGQDALVVVFSAAQGDFAVQLFADGRSM